REAGAADERVEHRGGAAAQVLPDQPGGGRAAKAPDDRMAIVGHGDRGTGRRPVMSRSTLTERYVWAVARHLPEEIGPDVAEELRSSLAETIEAKIDAGAAPHEAEREAITELGDPDVLARGYGGMPNHLIGPAVYPDFIRLLKILLVAVPSIVFVVSATVNAMTGDTHPGMIALDAALLAFTVAVHVGFWTGLTFALV